MTLVLSLFPGADLLGMAFEAEGFTVVQGPDAIFGRDIRNFHPPAGRFDGIIGGPPCQLFTRLRHLVPTAGQKHGNQIPEFERCVDEAQPTWFLMEEVPDAPEPSAAGYIVKAYPLNNRWLGEAQERKRVFSFGTRDGRPLHSQLAALESVDYCQAVTSSARRVPVALVQDGLGGHKPKRGVRPDGKRPGPDVGQRESIAAMAERQGLASTFLSDAPFTAMGKRVAIGNGVPIPMGRAIARAVKKALDGGLR